MAYRDRHMIALMDRESTGAALTAAQGDAVRALLRALLVRDWEGNQTAAARALGVQKATVNQILSGRKRAGFHLASALARYLTAPVERVLASEGDLVRATSPDPGEVHEATFGDLPGWPSLLESAQASDPSLPSWVWPLVARARVWLTTPVTVAFVLATARIVRDHVPPPHR